MIPMTFLRAIPCPAVSTRRGSERVNTTSSRSGRVDDIQSQPLGEFRGQKKLVNIAADVRKFAAQQKLSEDEALKAGMEQKAREFSRAGAEIYSKV